MDERVETVRAQPFQQEDLDPAAARLAAAEEPGRVDAAVVDHEEVAGPQPRRQVGNVPVGDPAGGPLEDQQTRGPALGRRRLRNLLGRQGKVEVGDEHAPS